LKIAEQVPSSLIVVGVVLYPGYAVVPVTDDAPHGIATVVPGACIFGVGVVDTFGRRNPHTKKTLKRSTRFCVSLLKRVFLCKRRGSVNLEKHHLKNKAMNTRTDQIKSHLRELIIDTNDESILSKVEAYFTTLKGKNTDWWETITPTEKEDIKTGLQQLDNGEGIPYNTVKDKVDQLLGRL
jgi:hypothetical protein